ncbi:MAG: DUF3499 domain-containing protein [Actinobacteria bacterium]|nr:DUF3499 domain-containing protein [Actinomycetota bacterium]
MADMGEARSATRDAVVRPLSRVAGRPCARPGCPSPARATLSFRYATREAWLEGLADEASPATYDLCGAHADKTRPPTGWGIVDQRPADDQEAATSTPSRDLGDEHTVAVLAAALRAVPDRPASPAPVEVEAEAEAVVEPEPELLDAEDTRSPGVVALDELELSDGVRGGIEDALAELAAVARGDEGAEQIAIALDDDPAPTTAPAEGASDTHAPAEGAHDVPVPRPVRAARERASDDTTGGPARSW